MERELLAFHTGDRSLLLLDALECEQTHSYNQALAVFEELMEMEGNAKVNEHFMVGARTGDAERTGTRQGIRLTLTRSESASFSLLLFTAI